MPPQQERRNDSYIIERLVTIGGRPQKVREQPLPNSPYIPWDEKGAGCDGPAPFCSERYLGDTSLGVQELMDCRGDVAGVDAGGVQELLGFARSRHVFHGEVLEVEDVGLFGEG